ncbi:MBL fold metallo-hydrolase [Paraprevotella xylaniphila]|uniref:MBL fold metallo-hydrolase n=1 Tax=Paraprevotella xylaniphila TaxID=454155 RepID=UPI00266594B1|nr:MBL fold metallo-hydrolase [Paraprevotella xylaniphila]
MMLLKVIGSDSHGNSYVLETESEALLIEAGCSFLKIKEAIGYNVRKICACVISHAHGDHAGYTEEIKKSGIPVLGNRQVNPTIELIHGHGYKSGGFRILPLSVEHDVPCFAYVVEHPEMGKLLFVTDTMDFNYRISSLSHILIEANYSDEQLERNIESGLLPVSLRNRIVLSHMEIGTTVDVLNSMDLSQVTDIVLIHLSSGNGDAANFIAKVQGATGKPVTVAVPGLMMNLNKEPY